MNLINFSANFKNYFLITTIVFFAIALLLAGLILWPKFQVLTTLHNSIVNKNLALESSKNYVAQLQDAKNKLTNYQPEMDKINSSLPADPDVPSLFNFIQKISSQSGLVLNDIGTFTVSTGESSPSSLAFPSSAMKQISFNVSVVGSYPSFKNFVSNIEKSARLISIENITFAPASSEIAGTKSLDVFTFTLGLKTYSY